MGFRVEGVTEVSLTSDVFAACLFQHSWRGGAKGRGGGNKKEVLEEKESLEPGI